MLLPLVADVPGESTEFLDRMAGHSKTLQVMIDRAGMPRGAGIRLVAKLAREHGLRDWPDTRNERDYLGLIEVLERFLRG